MRWTTSKQMALCGVLAALAVSTMVLGGLFPAATYFCPVLACLMLVPVTQTCGRRIAWAWYGAVAILSCLLCPDVEASALFVFLGYYPIVKGRLDRIRLRPLRWLSTGSPLGPGYRSWVGRFDLFSHRSSPHPVGNHIPAKIGRKREKIERGLLHRQPASFFNGVRILNVAPDTGLPDARPRRRRQQL